MLHDADGSTDRARIRLRTLVDLTQIPTASGREDGVIAWVHAWVSDRPHLQIEADARGNLVLSAMPAAEAKGRSARGATRARRVPPAPPLFITAHLDHPAFVVERVDQRAGSFELSFRGGVQDVFFEHAPITVHAGGGARLPATLTGKPAATSPLGTVYTAELDPGAGSLAGVRKGDIATWTMPGSAIDGRGILHAPACDDLAAAAAALCTLDEYLAPANPGTGTNASPQPRADVRVLLTRAEEIGFIGALAACRLGTMPKGSRVLALENSRAFPESPIGGGPVVRVGDRLSIFTPWLTAASARRAEEAFGGPAQPTAAQGQAAAAKRPWQRKLMQGGACEATVFCHAGYDATCLCLPLGNYHNMPHLDLLQAGKYDATVLGPPRCEREFIDTADYLSLVDLLVALAERLPGPDEGDIGPRLERLYADKQGVLGPASKAAMKAPASTGKKATKAKTNKPGTKPGVRSKASKRRRGQ